MKMKENIKEVGVVEYTKEQDEFNYVSHFLGVPVGITIAVIGVVLYCLNKLSLTYMIGILVFGVMAILLYSMSAGYHHLDKDNKYKRLFRVIDHCTIYVLIAGTYTPICLYVMSQNYWMGLIILLVQWFLALVGVILNAYDMKNKWVQAISMGLYIALGWMALYTTAFTYLPQTSFVLILIGGIAYTLGSILYGIGHKNLWFHCVFHVFVLIGTIFQAIGVIFLFI